MPVTVENIGAAATDYKLGDWVKQATVDTAYRVLREEVGRGFDRAPTVVTDGVRRRAPEEVKPFGKIEFVASTSLADAVRWALTELQRKSPVLTGRYAGSHVVMLNGAEIAGNIWQTLRSAKPADRVQIVNTQPYARKIEGERGRATSERRSGKAKRRALSSQARAGVYRPVLRGLVERWGKSMFFDFKYVKLDLGVKVWGDQGGRYRKDGSRTYVRRVQRDQVYPALQFFNPGNGPAN